MGVSVYPATDGAYPQVQRVITSSGVVDLGTTRQVYMVMTGGGGGGGGGRPTTTGGGGGGAAGAVAGKLAFKSAYFVIGAGGTGGTAQNNGANGGNSAFVKQGYEGDSLSTNGTASAIIACGGGGGGGAGSGSIPSFPVFSTTTLTISGITTFRYAFGDSGSVGGINSLTTQPSPNVFPTLTTWNEGHGVFQTGWTNNAGGMGTYSGTAYNFNYMASSNQPLLPINFMDVQGYVQSPTSATFGAPNFSFISGTGTGSGGFSRGGQGVANGAGRSGRHGIYCAAGAGGVGWQANTNALPGGSNSVFNDSSNTGGAGPLWPGPGGGGGHGYIGLGSPGGAGDNSTTGNAGSGGAGGLGGGGGGGGGSGPSSGGTTGSGGAGGAGCAVLLY